MKILGIDPGYGKCGWAILAKPGKYEIRNPKYETNSNVQKINNQNKKKFKKLENSNFGHCFEFRASNFDIELVACDCIETDKKNDLPDRLKEIYDGIQYVVNKYQPQELAIEELFWFKNQKTALSVAQARGVIITAAKNLGLEIYEYTPLQVKQAVVGYGRADKNQIQRMIKIHLGGQVTPKQDDAADAIAIGLTHLQTQKLEARNPKHETNPKFK